MKKLTLFLSLFLFNAQAFAAEDAVAIMNKSFLASKVKDSVGNSTFRLFNASGQERVRETLGSTKLIDGTTDNRRLVSFESPADVKGTKTLLVEHSKGEDDIWIYLPALKKVRRLVASNKKDAFVGTDFSYGDVIGQKVEDWNHKILREDKADGKDVWVVESLPKSPEVAENSAYSKRISWVDKESYVVLKGEVFDSAGQLYKKFSAKNLSKVDAANNKWQPMIMEAQNVQSGTRTVLEFSNYKANVGVSDDIFSARSLEKK